jgi:hypothetical protein
MQERKRETSENGEIEKSTEGRVALVKLREAAEESALGRHAIPLFVPMPCQVRC